MWDFVKSWVCIFEGGGLKFSGIREVGKVNFERGVAKLIQIEIGNIVRKWRIIKVKNDILK